MMSDSNAGSRDLANEGTMDIDVGSTSSNPIDVDLNTGGMDGQGVSYLRKIPLEILVRIAKFISTDDIANTRLTCKSIERNLFNYFSREFFKKKQFMAYSISLQALLDISKHPGLGPCLKHVIICTDRLDDTMQLANIGVDADQERRQEQIDLYCADHTNLLCTGRLHNILAEAFANLPNLETIDIRDFNSRTRDRDVNETNQGGYWSSYGSVTIRRDTGIRPPLVSRGPLLYKYPSQLLNVLLSALATAKSRPGSLEVITRRSGVDDSAFFISPWIRQPVEQLLAGLKTLHLAVYPGNQYRVKMPMMRKFLILVPNIIWLRLNFTTGHPIYPGQKDQFANLLYWIAGCNDDGSRIDDPPQVPSFQLKTLDLGDMELVPAQLLGLVDKFAPTLRDLSLRRVCLKPPRADPDPQDKPNMWATLFARFGRVKELELRKVSLGWLRQGPVPVVFQIPTDGTTMQVQCPERTFTFYAEKPSVVEQVRAEIRPAWPIDRNDDDQSGM